jgi:hypothetical protein
METILTDSYENDKRFGPDVGIFDKSAPKQFKKTFPVPDISKESWS